MVFIEILVHGFHQIFGKYHGLQFVVLINFLKKSWTIVHGFHRIFGKNHEL